MKSWYTIDDVQCNTDKSTYYVYENEGSPGESPQNDHKMDTKWAKINLKKWK